MTTVAATTDTTSTSQTTTSTITTAGSGSTSGGTADEGSSGTPQPACEVVVDEQFTGGVLDALWDVEPGEPMITIEDGYAQWTAGPLAPQSYRGIYWPERQPLVGMHVAMEIRQAPTFDDYELRLDLVDDNGLLVGWLWDEGELQAETYDYVTDRGMQIGSVPFDATEDRFLRVREASGRILFESSPDGRSFEEHFVIDGDMFGADVGIAVAVQAQPGVGDVIQVDSIQICAVP